MRNETDKLNSKETETIEFVVEIIAEYHKHPKHTHTHTHTHQFNQSMSGTTLVSRYQKGKTNLDLLKQETVSGSGISRAVCKSAPCSRQITMLASHHSKVFYRPDALPAAQPTASKH